MVKKAVDSHELQGVGMDEVKNCHESRFYRDGALRSLQLVEKMSKTLMGFNPTVVREFYSRTIVNSGADQPASGLAGLLRNRGPKGRGKSIEFCNILMVNWK